jgi:hypothetical protein
MTWIVEYKRFIFVGMKFCIGTLIYVMYLTYTYILTAQELDAKC